MLIKKILLIDILSGALHPFYYIYFIKFKPKEIEIREDPYQSLIHSITAPVDHVYLNMFNTQRLREDDLLNDLPSSINSKLEVIDFPLELDGTRNIPLSWQLTQSDKNLIRESFFTPKNKTSINRVKYHLLN